MHFLKFLSRVDILIFQVTYLFILTVCFACEVSGLALSTLAVVTISCICKMLDNLMGTKNSFFHVDSFFIFNSSAVLLAICYFENSPEVVALALFVFSQTSLIEFYLVEHTQVAYSNLHYVLLVMITCCYYAFAITSAVLLHGSWSKWFNVNLLSFLLKLLYTLHIYGYRQGSGFYNDFLIEVGGGESPLRKNVGYHLVNYLFKIIVLGILLPLVYLETLWLIVLVMTVTSIVVVVFVVILMKDCHFIYQQRRNMTELEKRAIMEESIEERI